MNESSGNEHSFHGSVTVGERGQVVIPAEARKKFAIETGDKLLVFSHPSGGGLMMVKVDAFEDMLRFFSDAAEHVKRELAVQDESETKNGSRVSSGVPGL